MNSSEFLKYMKCPSLLSAETLPVLEQIVQDYPWFQPGWALYLKNLKNLGSPAYQAELSRVSVRISDRKWLKGFLEDKAAAGKYGPGAEDHLIDIADYPVGDLQSDLTPASGNTGLIDDFLAQGARFKVPAPGEQAKPGVDLAEKAAALSDDIVTEKFADLLVSQSKFKEALESFQKLSLKFPEKSIYFAARIEEVRRKMNY